MAKDEFEIIPMGKSPVHEATEWLIVYEFLCKQLAAAFGVPPELLKPSNKGLQSDGGWTCAFCGLYNHESVVKRCCWCKTRRR